MNQALLIEDDSTTATLLMAVLKLNRLDVDVVGSGDHAVRTLEAKDYAVVIVDLLLPRVDGFAIVEYIKAARPELLNRVIVISGASKDELSRLDLTSFRGFLPKPVVVEELVQLLP